MGGVFVNQVISKSCPHRSERVEDFTHVSVEVRGKKGLEESLASYVSGELLEADNQWSCESCGAKRDAVKRSCFRGDALPDTLCVHLKRFEFDYETMQRHKIKSRFEFPETPGALRRFLDALPEEWNVSLFHYRNHGSDKGKVLVGLQLPDNAEDDFEQFVADLGYAYVEETHNPVYRNFMA